MAGSITWRAYSASVPAIAIFSVQVDESNARATYNGSQLMPVSTLPPTQKPKSLTMRSVRASLAGNPRITRRFWVAEAGLWATIAGDPAATILAPYAPDANDANGGQVLTWQVSSAPEEKYTRRPRVIDSGLVDGTPDN
jgi:hypothetical protein